VARQDTIDLLADSAAPAVPHVVDSVSAGEDALHVKADHLRAQ